MASYYSEFMLDQIKNAKDKSKKYKNKYPTKKEFGIENVNIEEIKKINEQKKKVDNGLSGTLGILWWFFGGVPAGFLAAEFWNESAFLGIIIFVGVFFGIAFIFEKLSKSFVDNKYKENDDIYSKIKSYEEAVSSYEWWQRRKEYEFWLDLSDAEFLDNVKELFILDGFDIYKCNTNVRASFIIKNNGTKEIIKCKRFEEKASPANIRDFCKSMLKEEVDKGYLITICGCTSEAETLSKELNISVLDIEHLVMMKNKLESKNRTNRN